MAVVVAAIVAAVVGVYLFIYLSVCLSICLSANLKTKLFFETSSSFERGNVKNKEILRDFFNFQVDNIKNEAILRDILQKWKVECRADGLVPMRFAFFPLLLSKYCEKVMLIRSAAPVTQNHLSKPEDLMLQNATLRKSAP